MIGTGLILGCSYFIWKREFIQNTGFSIKRNVIINAIILLIIITFLSFFIMKFISLSQSITIQLRNWKGYIHILFYVLNEEIVLGAITLFLMVRKLKLSPLAASLILALMFSVIHLVFYRWIFNDRVFLYITTLITLFLIGIVRNNLILYTGHIGYSWALHAGWMLVMFGCDHYSNAAGDYLSESNRFNLYLGSIPMLIVSLVLASLSIYYMNRKKDIIAIK